MRVLGALSTANFTAPFAAGYLEQKAGLAPVVGDPIEMGSDQAGDAFSRPAASRSIGQASAATPSGEARVTYLEMGGAGGPAGATGGGGVEAVWAGGSGVAVAVAEGVIAGSALSEGGAAGAGVTGGTGSGRSGVGSLPPVSFSASTLAVSGLGSEAGLEPSALSPSPLPTSVLPTSGLAVSTFAVSLLDASSFDASSGFATSGW